MPIKRVLVLHGYAQNATFSSNRLAALRKEAQDVEFVFLDGPIVLHPADPITHCHGHTNLSSDGAAAAASSVLTRENEGPEAREQDLSKVPRAWWLHNSDFITPVGVENALVMIKKVLQEKRFDGVLGFSQGAALATMISALLETPQRYPPFLVDDKAPHPPFKFCIAVSGFRLPFEIWNNIFQTPYSTPTLHIIGKNDIVVTEERSKLLMRYTSDYRVEQHDGGHYVPTRNVWPRFFVECMRKPFDEVPSPRVLAFKLSMMNSKPTITFESTESRGLRTYL